VNSDISGLEQDPRNAVGLTRVSSEITRLLPLTEVSGRLRLLDRVRTGSQPFERVSSFGISHRRRHHDPLSVTQSQRHPGNAIFALLRLAEFQVRFEHTVSIDVGEDATGERSPEQFSEVVVRSMQRAALSRLLNQVDVDQPIIPIRLSTGPLIGRSLADQTRSIEPVDPASGCNCSIV
jgi:hypothetical protein